MEWADDIGSRPAAWTYVPVQSYSCSLRAFYRTLVVGKDTYAIPFIIIIIIILIVLHLYVNINTWHWGKPLMLPYSLGIKALSWYLESKKNKLLVSLRGLSLPPSSTLTIFWLVSALQTLAFFLFYHLILVQLYFNDCKVSNMKNHYHIITQALHISSSQWIQTLNYANLAWIKVQYSYYCNNKCFLLLGHYNFHRKTTTTNWSNIPSGTFMVHGKTVKCPARDIPIIVLAFTPISFCMN